MSHEFESGVFAGNQPAWHGLGITLPNESLDSQEALQYSGLNGWNLTKQPVYAGNPDGGFTPIDGHYAVTRETDQRVLGVVGKGYSIVQNEDAFDWMDALLGGEGFHYQTAGALRGGKIVWLLAKAPFAIDLPDSPVDMYVLLSNSHDGSKAVQAAITPVRVVCMNTLRAALSAEKAHYTIRHTANAAQKLSEAQRVLGLTKGAADRMEAAATKLAKAKLTAKQFDGFLNQLVPMPAEDGRSKTLAQKTQDTIREIYTSAPDQQDIKGTSWGAWNAVVAYSDHYLKSRATDGTAAAENHMIRVMLKDSERQLPKKALALLA